MFGLTWIQFLLLLSKIAKIVPAAVPKFQEAYQKLTSGDYPGAYDSLMAVGSLVVGALTGATAASLPGDSSVVLTVEDLDGTGVYSYSAAQEEALENEVLSLFRRHPAESNVAPVPPNTPAFSWDGSKLKTLFEVAKFLWPLISGLLKGLPTTTPTTPAS